MINFLRCTGAIARFEVLLRFRRTSTVVILLLFAASVYFIVPEVSTGRTLMQIDGRRVLYNSATVAVGTVIFCAMFLSLFGYYLVSNTIKRDIVTRTGLIIATAPVTKGEYVIGKFLGNTVYLSAVMVVCMLSAMVMMLLRGDGALEPFVFVRIYLWVALPPIILSSAAALTFESLPLLSGRFGDVLYFFVWGALLAVPVTLFENKIDSLFINTLDVMGLIPLITQLQEQFHTQSISIGMAEFNAAREPILFTGIKWSWLVVGRRFFTLILPVLMIIAAWLTFHRFNPTRIKSYVQHNRKNLLGRINTMLKPAMRFIEPLAGAWRSGNTGVSFAGAVHADTIMTLWLSPLTIVAIIVFAILSLVFDTQALREGLLPAIVVALIISLADIVSRDRTAGMMNLLFTAPRLRMQYVFWKYISVLFIAICFTFIPIVRLFAAVPSAGISLTIGTLFMAGGAVGFGVITRNQKTYIALYLMLLYIALNAPTESVLDFAGINACATTGVQLGYAFITFILILSAYFIHRMELKKL